MISYSYERLTTFYDWARLVGEAIARPGRQQTAVIGRSQDLEG
jgi:hypothetical protein